MHLLKSRQGLVASLTLLTTSSLVFLAGCGVSNSPVTGATKGLSIQGSVHGGAQGVKGSQIHLYKASTSGYANAATDILTTPVFSATDGTGSFSITADYTCAAGDQLYLVAVGGDPGVGTANPNLVLAAGGLGACSSGTLNTSLFVDLNEVTTVATAYALSHFASDFDHVGTTATNAVGLQNAMSTINNLVNIGNGTALTVTPYYTANNNANFNTSIVPQAQINSLADILSTCVNSSGGSACTPLFSAVPGTTPTNTFKAALDIAQNPGQKIAQVYSVLPASVGSPFQPTVTAQPNDWTLQVTYIGGGLGGSTTANRGNPGDLKIDANGNIWISGLRSVAANNPLGGRMYELSPLGAALSPSTAAGATTPAGFTGGGLNGTSQVAIDLEGDAWSEGSGGVISAFSPAGVPLFPSGIHDTTNNTLAGIGGISIDGLDNVWGFNTSSSLIVKVNHAGSILSGTGYTNNVTGPGAIAINANEHAVFPNGTSTMTEFDQTGSNALNGNPGGALNNPINRMAFDRTGQFWLPETAADQVLVSASVLTSASIHQYSAASLSGTSAIAIDGDNQAWLVGSSNATVTGFTNAGSVITPSATGLLLEYGQNVAAAPTGIGVDPSGNVWVANQNSIANAGGQGNVQEFIGLAAPTVTPVAVAVKNNTLGQRP